MSQRKYVLHLLTKTSFLGACPTKIPMDSTVKLDKEQFELDSVVGRYCCLVGKLIYLMITGPNITYAVSVVSQFMKAPRQPQYEAICRILCYLKGAAGHGPLYKPSPTLYVTGFSDDDWAGSHSDCWSTSGYCTFVGGNLVTWHSKKQNVVACSSAKAEYRAMAHTNSKMLWVQSLLHELGVVIPIPMQMCCDNQATIFIAKCSMNVSNIVMCIVTSFGIY